MIYLYRHEADGVWYAVALEKKEIVATAFSFSEENVLRHLLDSLPYDTVFQVAEEPSEISQRMLETLRRIYVGESVSVRVQVDMSYLSSYIRGVLQCMMKIPVGYVATYGAISEIVGGSPRAVGRAASVNPFPLLVPCHRVVKTYSSKNFACSIGGYGLGSQVKLGILRREDRGYIEPTTIEVDNKVFQLHPVSCIKEL